MNHLTDAEVLAIREAAYEEARKYSDNLQRQLERAEKKLLIAEAVLTADGREDYDLLCEAAGLG